MAKPALSLPAPYSLRPMQPTDLDSVYQIETLSLPTPTKPAVYRRELLQNSLAHYQLLTCTEAGHEQIVGHSGYWLLADELHISIIAVHPDWRGRGCGDLLLLAMLRQALMQGLTAVTLEVRRRNKIAQKLYHKHQFTPVGKRPRYYRDTGDDALIMTVTPLDDAYATQVVRRWRQSLHKLKQSSKNARSA